MIHMLHPARVGWWSSAKVQSVELWVTNTVSRFPQSSPAHSPLRPITSCHVCPLSQSSVSRHIKKCSLPRCHSAVISALQDAATHLLPFTTSTAHACPPPVNRPFRSQWGCHTLGSILHHDHHQCLGSRAKSIPAVRQKVILSRSQQQVILTFLHSYVTPRK